jgi:hypothetical protein
MPPPQAASRTAAANTVTGAAKRLPKRNWKVMEPPKSRKQQKNDRSFFYPDGMTRPSAGERGFTPI